MARKTDHVDVAATSAVLEALGLPFSLLSPLLAHAEAVRSVSPRLGLVSTGDEDAIVRRHTADSLLFAIARSPRSGERWVDVGSGGGFPGIVLAICYPQTGFSLVEAQRKKAGFLDMQVLDLGLGNVQVIPERAERVESGFDVAVARAVADPADLVQQLIDLVRPGGEIVVAGTGEVPGAQVVEPHFPEVDSPRRLLMMTRTSP